MQLDYRILEYVAPDGSTPFIAWLGQLSDLRAKARILMRIKRAESGNVGQYKSVGEGVLELIVDVGPGYRIYFAFASRRDIVLLAGGTKRSQRRDIPNARNRWSDFRSRSDSREFGS